MGEWVGFNYSEFPGGRSRSEVGFYLDYCRDEGYIEAQLSGDYTVGQARMTSSGLKYLQGRG